MYISGADTGYWKGGGQVTVNYLNYCNPLHVCDVYQPLFMKFFGSPKRCVCVWGGGGLDPALLIWAGVKQY